MGTGVSILLIAVGAILTFGVNLSTRGFDLGAVGVILMVLGVIGLLADLVLSSDRGRMRRGPAVREEVYRSAPRDEVVVEERPEVVEERVEDVPEVVTRRRVVRRRRTL